MTTIMIDVKGGDKAPRRGSSLKGSDDVQERSLGQDA
jgi:hypothetical protein